MNISTVKSFSVGNGDMFYIMHASPNFSIIDCCLSEDNKDRILEEIHKKQAETYGIGGIVRFISTHPDEDHILGLKDLDAKIDIRNFYCVKNSVTKEDPSPDFQHYCKWRDEDGINPAFNLHRNCRRQWMNEASHDRMHANIKILWPNTDNQYYKGVLKAAADGDSPNNLSPIIHYSLDNIIHFLWMGDLETDFMENITDDVKLPKAHVLFAPHHGRDSGKVPKKWLDKIQPNIVVVGEAPSKHLHYYHGYNTITQNSAGDIAFECDSDDKSINIYVRESSYKRDFLTQKYSAHKRNGLYYLGTLEV